MIKKQKNRSFFNRGVYLLPNLFTTVALAFGFLCINASMNGRYAQASIYIVLAAIMDALDGRVARLTGTQSEFGAQFDSLSDMVSFGVAPAILAYSWSLNEYGKFGIMVAFCYALSVAIRLARFNVSSSKPKTSFSFEGLPSPASAVAICSPIWYLSTIDISGSNLSFFTLLIILIIAPLTVSILPYPSFKKIGFRKVVSFWQALLFIIALILLVVEPALMIMIYTWVYVSFALLLYLFKKDSKNKKTISE